MKSRLVRSVAATFLGLFAAGAIAVVPAQATDTAAAGGNFGVNGGPAMCC